MGQKELKVAFLLALRSLQRGSRSSAILRLDRVLATVRTEEGPESGGKTRRGEDGETRRRGILRW